MIKKLSVLFFIVVTTTSLVSSCGTSSTGNLTIKGAGSASSSVFKGIDLQASNPSSLKLKVYKVAFSESELCTNLQTVYSKEPSEVTYADFLLSPSIAEGVSLTDGTYKCVVIEFSDTIKPTPAASEGSCTVGTEFNLDVCSGSTTSTLIDGTSTTCTSGEDCIAMYISTASTETTGTNGHNAFERPTVQGDATKGFKLLSSFVKAGAKTGTFVVNGTGKIDGSGGSCEMYPPLFSFE